jgi:hypothetical protein
MSAGTWARNVQAPNGLVAQRIGTERAQADGLRVVRVLTVRLVAPGLYRVELSVEMAA